MGASSKEEKIRKELIQSLDEFVKEQSEFPRPERPLALKNLKVVAFIQDDATNEVLNAPSVTAGWTWLAASQSPMPAPRCSHWESTG